MAGITAGGTSNRAVAEAAAFVAADRSCITATPLTKVVWFIAGSITGTLTCGWCIGTEDGSAKMGAIAIALFFARGGAIGVAPMMPAEGGADTAQTKEAADRRCSDKSERVAS
jgi:hypothetical protein